MHGRVLYIGEDPEEWMDNLTGSIYDYWGVLEDDKPIFADEQIKVGDLKTVGDVKKLGVEKINDLFYAVIDGGAMFWDMHRTVPKEVMAKVFESILENFEDDQPVHVLDVHI